MGRCRESRLLAIPTALLALMPDLATFAALRLMQGVFMSAAFSLTIAYLAENAAPHEVAAALAAYVTGNVASNLFGRLMSAAIADHLGSLGQFRDLRAAQSRRSGARFLRLRHTSPMQKMARAQASRLGDRIFRQTHLGASFAIGFLILFAFIGTFTYVNFVSREPPLDLSPMQLGFVYFVFVPSIILTPIGRPRARAGSAQGEQSSLHRSVSPPCALPALLAAKLELSSWRGCHRRRGHLLRPGHRDRLCLPHRRPSARRRRAVSISLPIMRAALSAASCWVAFSISWGWPATVTAIGMSLVIGCLLAMRLHEPNLLTAQ